MPNRILKESICTSDTVDTLSWFEEVFFYRLIVNCDDYGRMDARPAILKANLFPLKNITVADIEKTLNKLSAAGLVYRYIVNDKPYLQLVTWEKYQQVRSKKSKCPAPEEGMLYDKNTAHDIKCNQKKSNVPVIQSNPIQSESEFESEYKHGAAKTADVPEQLPVVSLMLNDKSFCHISQSKIDHWSELYPAVDIKQELLKMQGWLESNPAKRKTKNGIERFITGWLAKEQDKGRMKPVAQDKPKSRYDYEEFERKCFFNLHKDKFTEPEGAED